MCEAISITAIMGCRSKSALVEPVSQRDYLVQAGQTHEADTEDNSI